MKIEGAGSALIRASLKTEKETYDCIGTVLAKHGCWSFLKGGFVLNSPSQLSMLFFQVNFFFPTHWYILFISTLFLFLPKKFQLSCGLIFCSGYIEHR